MKLLSAITLAAVVYLTICRRHVEQIHPLFSDPWYMGHPQTLGR